MQKLVHLDQHNLSGTRLSTTLSGGIHFLFISQLANKKHIIRKPLFKSAVVVKRLDISLELFPDWLMPQGKAFHIVFTFLSSFIRGY